MKKFHFLSALVMMMALSMSFVSCGDDDPVSKSSDSKSDDKPATASTYVILKVTVQRDLVNCDLEKYCFADEIDNLGTNATKILQKVMTDNGGSVSSDYSTRYTFSGEQSTVQQTLKTALEAAKTSLSEVETNLGGKFSYTISSSSSSFYDCKDFISQDITLKQPLFATFTSGNFKYQALPNNHAAVIANGSLDEYRSSTYSGDVVVPSSVTDNGTTYTVTVVGPMAFYSSNDASPITSISLPSTITTICTDAFEYNYKLTKINIPASVKTFIKGAYSTNNMFNGAELTDVTLEEGLSVLPKYVFDDNTKLTSISIPASLTTIPYACFSGCSALSNVTIAEGVKVIDGYAFASTPVANLDFIPSSVTTIGESAFASCLNLETITLKEGLTTLGHGAFSSSKNIKKITLPSTLTSLDVAVFNNCTALEEVHFKGTTPATLTTRSELDSFTHMPSTCKLYVPSASVDAYKKAAVWSNYASQIVGE